MFGGFDTVPGTWGTTVWAGPVRVVVPSVR